MTKVAGRTAKTPVGTVWMIAIGDCLWACEFEARWSRLLPELERAGVSVEPGARFGRSIVLTQAASALRSYFAGDLAALRSVKLDLGGTDFQREVWRAVRRVPPGRTMTYGRLAERMGRSGSFRAVGAANGANRCALFIPCHRVVSSDGRMVGYGGGVQAKAFLLTHEGVALEGARVERPAVDERRATGRR